MGTVVDLLEGWATIQKELNRMERWADRKDWNLMQFNKEKCRAL